MTAASAPERYHAGAGVAALVAGHVHDVPDFPSPGILFKDITPLLGDGPAWAAVVADIADRYRGVVGTVVGIEARGFIMGGAVAYALGAGFVPVRKVGKLPRATLSLDYDLEYASASIEIHADSLRQGQRVLVLDDVLATGGTAAAACALLERAGAEIVGVEFLVELADLGGRARLPGRPVHALLTV